MLRALRRHGFAEQSDGCGAQPHIWWHRDRLSGTALCWGGGGPLTCQSNECPWPRR